MTEILSPLPGSLDFHGFVCPWNGTVRTSIHLYKAGRHASVLKLSGSNLSRFTAYAYWHSSWFTSASAADFRVVLSNKSLPPPSKCYRQYSWSSPEQYSECIGFETNLRRWPRNKNNSKSVRVLTSHMKTGVKPTVETSWRYVLNIPQTIDNFWQYGHNESIIVLNF
jgi:hypothetical protein